MAESGRGGRDSSGDGAGGGDQPWFVREGGEEPPWRDLFLGGSPRQILARLCAHDALRLADLCAFRLSSVVLLIHPDRLASRAVARVAFGAAEGYGGKPPLRDWLVERVDQSIRELLEEDVEEERCGTPLAREQKEQYMELIPRETGIEGDLARRACICFNVLPATLREPFFRTVFEGVGVEEYALARDLSLDEVVRRIDEVTRTLVHSLENGTTKEEDLGQ